MIYNPIRMLVYSVVTLFIINNSLLAENECGSTASLAAKSLAVRVIPKHADKFSFEVIQSDDGQDVFELESNNGKVVIRGNNGVSMAMGLNWYLKYYCKCSASLSGDNLELPSQLPEIKGVVRKESWAKYRYFLNYCAFGYSLPWYDWNQWERLIDWMALNGINAPLAVTGQEATWQAVCKRLDLGDKAVADFLAGPPYLSFGWMGCLDGWGGPLPQSWIDSHATLGKKILDRERELGMTPVQQGFTGHVPAALKAKFPNAKLHQVHWVEWTTYLLDPLDPLFQKVADIFMEEQANLFGTDHLYAADTFIEMNPPDGNLKYLGDMSRAIYNGMENSDPEAVWVLQTWMFYFKRNFWTQPRIKAFLDAVPNEHMLCLDLVCEEFPQWAKTKAFYGKPWVWCNIQNFGDKVFLGGNLKGINRVITNVKRSPECGNLSGLGFVNEGLGYNPVIYDLMFEMAWRNKDVDLTEWIEGYVAFRYGQSNIDAENAWLTLNGIVYSAPNRYSSTVNKMPTMKPIRDAHYDTTKLTEAWESLLKASDVLSGGDAYRFDLVNLARQVLSNHASVMHRNVIAAYRDKDAESFQSASNSFLELMLDMDELLATREEFLLGKNLEDAKRWGNTVAEKSILEWNARRVLTLWGETTRIDDYAKKEWSGMISGYYHMRWKRYLDDVAKSLEAGKPFDDAKFNRDLRKWMLAWSDAQESYPTKPKGDSVAIAKKLLKKYSDVFKKGAASLTSDKPVSCSSTLPQYPAHLANDGYRMNPNSFWATDVAQHPGDAWWQVDLEQPTDVGRVIVVCYYGDHRYYGFTVEASLDGKDWERVADRRNNKELSTVKGYTCTFDQKKVRYIKVTQTGNSANTGRHLVEVMAFKE